MSKWFNKEFYKHLWAISDRYGSDWAELAPENDPDLIYCRKIIDTKTRQSHIKAQKDLPKFIRNIVNNPDVVSMKQLSAETGIPSTALHRTLKKLGMVKYVKSTLAMRNTYILSRDNKIHSMYLSKYTLMGFIRISRRRADRIINTGEKIFGWQIYDYKGWLKHKGLSTDVDLTEEQKEKLKDAKFIRLQP